MRTGNELDIHTVLRRLKSLEDSQKAMSNEHQAQKIQLKEVMRINHELMAKNQELMARLSDDHTQAVIPHQFPHPASPMATSYQSTIFNQTIEILADNGRKAARNEALKNAFFPNPYDSDETRLNHTQKKEFVKDMLKYSKCMRGELDLGGTSIQDEVTSIIPIRHPDIKPNTTKFATYLESLNSQSQAWIDEALKKLKNGNPLPPITNKRGMHATLAYILIHKYKVKDTTPEPSYKSMITSHKGTHEDNFITSTHACISIYSAFMSHGNSPSGHCPDPTEPTQLSTRTGKTF